MRPTRRVGEAVEASGGLDHNYVLDGEGLREAAVLRDPASGRTLTLLTDQPGLQVYAGGFFDGSVVGPGGTPYGAGAVHHRGEPGWPDVVVPAGGRAVTRLRWAFSTT